MKTVSYHKIEADESDYLYTNTSKLPNAGTGLFTAIPIYKDEMIAVYKGESLDADEAARRVNSAEDLYFINMPNGSILDSMHVNCFAKYANDAAAVSDSGYFNNAKIAFDDEDQVGIIAIRNIKVGEEIYCSYGKQYWRKHIISK